MAKTLRSALIIMPVSAQFNFEMSLMSKNDNENFHESIYKCTKATDINQLKHAKSWFNQNFARIVLKKL